MNTATVVTRVDLVKTDARSNSNKFYEITLYSNGDVVCRWGRVGAERGESQTHPGGGEAALREIERKKTHRGYRRVETPAASASVSGAAAVHAAARSALSDGAEETDELIALLASVNRHAIELASGGLITATASEGVQTARGPVSATAVAEARNVLTFAGSGDIDAIDRYLMLVPQKMPRTAGWHVQFTDPDFLTRQRDFLDQLDAAVAMSATGGEARFRHQLAVLPAEHEKVRRLRDRFERGRNSHHGDVAGLRLHRVWTLTDTTGAEMWTKTRAQLGGRTSRLWHGTVPANVLSILHRGLFVPPTNGSTIVTTGRMFGDGVYFSDQSTKSLRYSYGSWSRSGVRANRSFMFSADVAMGRELRTTASSDRAEVLRRMRQPARRYNSLVVKAGTCGVINNEMIALSGDQVQLRYLCEFR